MCPTSELPIWPSGRPTASPDASNLECAYFVYNESIKGVLAASMAETFGLVAIPQPSKIMSTTFLSTVVYLIILQK